MQTFRSRCARLGAIGAAALISVAGLSLISALPANADTTPVPTAQNWAYAGPTGFNQLQETGAASSPTTASQGSNFAITAPGGSQVVPATQSGVAVNYISDTNEYYEIPANSTFVSATAAGNLTWSGGTSTTLPNSGSAPMVIIECLTATQTGCDASSNTALSTAGGAYSGFAGPNPTFPYLLVSTGPTEIPANSTLVTPDVTVTLTASGAVGAAINWSQFEFKTGANITLFGSMITATIIGWPSAGVYDVAGNPTCDGKGTASAPGCPDQTTLPLTASLQYGAPPILTTTTISAPAPFINVTNSPPINSTATGVTINVTGLNWPDNETTGTLVWSGCPTGAACSDTGTFTTSGTGALTGSILFGANEQLTSSQSPITLTVTASDGTHTATTTVTVNPYQAFASTCSIGPAHDSTCTVNQTISATVIGTSLTISEVLTPPNGSNNAVTLSPVTLGIAGTTGCPAVPGTACNNQQFAQAQGLLNSVVVSDDRGTLSGWDVTGQLGGDFENATPTGPTVDNVIPADFLTWEPGVTLETPGSLPANNANGIGCPDQTPPPPSIPIVCTGPSGTPSGNGTAGEDPVNGTGVGVTGATAPAEVVAGTPAVLNNPAGSAKELCGTEGVPGGGGGFVCSAGLSLAVPPYVAAGTYSATLNLVVIGY